MADNDVGDVVERLFAEFERHQSLPQILAVVQQCREQLRWEPAGTVPELVERLARQRLATTTDSAARSPTPPN